MTLDPAFGEDFDRRLRVALDKAKGGADVAELENEATAEPPPPKRVRRKGPTS